MKQPTLICTASALAIATPLAFSPSAHAGGISPGATIGIGVGSLLLGGAALAGGLAAPPAYAGGYYYEYQGYDYTQYGGGYGGGYGYGQGGGYQQPYYGPGSGSGMGRYYQQPYYGPGSGSGMGRYYVPRRPRSCPVYRVPQYDSWGQFLGYQVQRVCQ